MSSDERRAPPLAAPAPSAMATGEDDYWRGDASETCPWCWNGPDTKAHVCAVDDLHARIDGMIRTLSTIASLLDKHADEYAISARTLAAEEAGRVATPPAAPAAVTDGVIAAARALLPYLPSTAVDLAREPRGAEAKGEHFQAARRLAAALAAAASAERGEA